MENSNLENDWTFKDTNNICERGQKVGGLLTFC